MLAHSFLIESSSKLLVTRTGIKAQSSLNLGRIRPLILELLALEWQKFHTFELEYLWSQLANLDQILCVASLGLGKGCIRFWSRLTLAHWTQVSDRCPLGYLFFFSFSFILFLSIYILLSPSPQQRKKKKNACTRTPKFLCIFLRNARPAPPPTPTPLPYTQMVILSNVLIQASFPSVCVGGGRLAPNWVPMLEKKGRRKAPKQCVTTLNIEWFFPLGPEKVTLFY